MAQVDIYTKPMCFFCMRARSLLEKKNVAFNEIHAGFDRGKREEMIQRSKGRMTYPQIFVGDVHVGGCDELLSLEKAGKLDALLGLDGSQ